MEQIKLHLPDDIPATDVYAPALYGDALAIAAHRSRVTRVSETVSLAGILQRFVCGWRRAWRWRWRQIASSKINPIKLPSNGAAASGFEFTDAAITQEVIFIIRSTSSLLPAD
ncbi:hypothetical protein F4W66_24970 (plasmid) [Escherichia coli]|nr:hypothetical protein F4W66_24970 [Escherichia coli]